MTIAQGDIALLRDPVAQALLSSRQPAQLAYTWTDGTPRVESPRVSWRLVYLEPAITGTGVST